MEKEILNRYCWVLNVLESCKTDEQIEVAQKLFENFLKLHNLGIGNNHITALKKSFEAEKKSKSSGLKSKTKRLFKFNPSKFFLF